MNEWKQFFNSNYASRYEEEVFTRNTAQELEFLIEEFKLPKGAAILDIGCGTGRHSIGLALQGYKMTGVDISPGMLKIGRTTARKEGLDIEFVCSDAQKYRAKKQFDGAICLCEGAFGLLGSADDPFEHDEKIIQNVYQVLKEDSRFIITVTNGTRNLRKYNDGDVAQGKYDVLTMVETSEMESITPQGKKLIKMRERGYTAPELKRILKWAGFKVEHIFGGTAGSWNRQVPKLDEYELMAISRKR
jgi:cyclopropane fatty-acyl-phospholipid synthase-like methyltransferase